MNLRAGIIKRCLEECEASTYKFKMGAVIFNKKIIVSSGHNDIRSSSIPDKYKVWPNSIHAEQDAIFNCKDWSKLKGCSILVFRISKTTKQLLTAMPCPKCLTLLKFVDIKTIFYSDSVNGIVKLK